MLFYPIVLIGIITWVLFLIHIERLKDMVDPSIKRIFPWRLFGGIIILGEMLPFIIGSMMTLRYEPSEFSDLGSFLLNPLTFLFTLILHGIPLVAFALFAKFLWEKRGAQLAAIIGAGIVIFSIIVLFNLVFWIDLYLGSASSTGGLIFLVIPVFGIFLLPIGYWCGWFAGKGLARIKGR